MHLDHGLSSPIGPREWNTVAPLPPPQSPELKQSAVHLKIVRPGTHVPARWNLPSSFAPLIPSVPAVYLFPNHTAFFRPLRSTNPSFPFSEFRYPPACQREIGNFHTKEVSPLINETVIGPLTVCSSPSRCGDPHRLGLDDCPPVPKGCWGLIPARFPVKELVDDFQTSSCSGSARAAFIFHKPRVAPWNQVAETGICVCVGDSVSTSAAPCVGVSVQARSTR